MYEDACIQGKIFIAVKNILSENFLTIDNGLETSERIKQSIGIIQGDPLSSTLFLIYVMTLPRKIMKTDSIKTIMFADDLVIYSENIEDLKESLLELNVWCKKYKLKINTSKSKVMKLRKGGKLKKTDILQFDNTNLEFVNEYEYLGVLIQPTLCITNHIKLKSVKAAYALASVGNMQYISVETINKIFQLKIDPIVTYCFGTLAEDLSAAHLINLDKIKARCFKKGLGLHKNTSNTLTFHLAGVRRYGEEIIERFKNKIDKKQIEEYERKVEEKNIQFV
ncbi:hypothetical protein WDU94_003695, partial [Cyamophila willieti]